MTAGSDVLHVWCERERVGRLWCDAANIIGFKYDEAWLEQGFPVSQSLPLAETAYEPGDGLAHFFFGNLLPEGNLRDRIVHALKIPDNDFDLLRAIGGECAGALSVLPDDQEPGSESHYAELSDDAFRKLVLSRGWYYGSYGDNEDLQPNHERPRLSLAGVQDKCLVLIQGGKYFLPRGESASSHILKFTVPDYKNIPLYEAFLTVLAQSIGLNVVGLEFKSTEIDKERREYLVIRRFDRVLQHDGSVKRLHQEDFCQALGIPRRGKYEGEVPKSADFRQCYRLLREASTEPALDLTQLLRWQIFNYLAGNADGHAKNLALLYGEGGDLRLAPFYDLVCTHAIERVNTKLAFSIGGEHQPANIRLKHWQKLAKDLGIRPRYLVDLVGSEAESLTTELPGSLELFRDLYGPYPALQRVEQVVRQHCRIALQQLAGVNV